MTDSFSIGHGGDAAAFRRISGRDTDSIIDFSVNVNPCGVPEFLRAVLLRGIERIHAYPEASAESALRAASDFHGISPNRILFGNGSNQLIHAIPAAFGIRAATILAPAFSEYGKALEVAGSEIRWRIGRDADGFTVDLESAVADLESGEFLFLANPSNPAGSLFEPGRILSAAVSRPECRFIVDEAFIEYAGEASSCLSDPNRLPENLVVLRSLTKFYGLAGIRIGYVVGSETMLERMRRSVPPWSVNTFAIESAKEIFSGGGEFRSRTFEENETRREMLVSLLAGVEGLQVFPSHANYLLVRTALPARTVFERMLKEHGIAVRDCSNFRGLETGGYLRVAVRTEPENRRLADAFAAILGGGSGRFHVPKRRCPSLMLQGTCSSAGKSVLTSAFCRILLREGYRVAPFKAQNMALNSHVTLDGCEIGRAQAVQALACRLEPDTRMNPILLKPNSDTGSQVIVMGKVVENMDVTKYFAYKKTIFSTVTEAYDSLASEFDVIVLEGAGSPGEINLKGGDIVNMRMARHAGGPVLLVGDIDRGGVYASFLGTYLTFENWEKDLLAGYVVNKFRGDSSLLAPAHDYLFRHTGRRVVGVVPYLRDIAIPEEDMSIVPFDSSGASEAPFLDVALVIPRHVSNFTDFAPWAIEPDVNLRLVRTVRDFGNPDVVILPGSKNVVGSLAGLEESGLKARIVEHAERGGWIIGVCGGLQMCGKSIRDPGGIESSRAVSEGFGFLDLDTVLESDKTLRRIENILHEGGVLVSGYEIHHGRTDAGETVSVTIRRGDGEPIGFREGNVWTTYLHGIFDDDRFRRWFIDRIRVTRNLPPKGSVQAVYSTDHALDQLADRVLESVDMKFILKKMGLK